MANSRRNTENTEYNVPGPVEHSNQEATNYNPNAGNQEQLLTEFQDNLAEINGKVALEWENRKDVGIEPLEANTEYTKDEIRALRDLNFTDAEKTQFQEDWAREKLASQFQLIENLAADGWEHRFVTDKELEALRADPNIEVTLISDLQTAAAGSTNDADLVHLYETDRKLLDDTLKRLGDTDYDTLHKVYTTQNEQHTENYRNAHTKMQSYLDQIVNAMNLEREKKESDDDYEERTAKTTNGVVAEATKFTNATRRDITTGHASARSCQRPLDLMGALFDSLTERQRRYIDTAPSLP